MKDQIKALEKEALHLEPTEHDRKLMFDKVWNYSNEFLNQLDYSKTYIKDFDDLTRVEETDFDAPSNTLDEILNLLGATVDRCGINPAGPGHLGYIPGGGIYSAALGDYLAAVTNRYAGLYYANPGAVKIENKLIRWTCDLLGYPKEALGNITSGGSIANLIALISARDHQNLKSEQVKNAVIYYSQQTHHCVAKAVRIAGLGECQTRLIELDHKYRMSSSKLAVQIHNDIKNGLNPFFVAASCGSTDTGAIDPLNDIGEICRQNGVWFHVDAAYGGYFIMVDELKEKFKGISTADSIVLDPHKSLFMPYGCGIVLIRNGQSLFNSFHYMANYLQDAYNGEEDPSPCDLSPELTKHFRGLRMWIPLRLHGLTPFKACLKEKWLLTKYFYNKVRELGFETGPDPELSVCIYRYKPENENANTFNRALLEHIQNDGRIFVSSTEIDGIFWLRVAIVCFRTHLRHIDEYLDILKKSIHSMLPQS